MLKPPFAVALACALCATNADAKPHKHQLTGMASYYWKGHRTASGERFDRNGFTAAHRTLPFGTSVRVINRRNGRAVSVRINDRGPFRRGRVIDVSRGAARHLGMVKSGVAPVRLEIGLTVAELRRVVAKIQNLSTARKEVRRPDDWSRLVGTPERPAPVGAYNNDEEISALMRHEYVRAVAMIEAEPPPSRSLFEDSPVAIVGNIFRQFLESLVKPVGNCREFDTIDRATQQVVRDTAKHFNGIAHATSCYRSAAYNRKIRGARASQHIRRKALDFRVMVDGKPVSPMRLAMYARNHPLMRKAGGVGTYCGTFIHVDSGPKRNWNWGCGRKQRTRFAYRKQHRG